MHAYAEHVSAANAAVTSFPLHHLAACLWCLQRACLWYTLLAMLTLPKAVMLQNIEFHEVLLGKQTSCMGLTAMNASTTLSVTRALAA